MSIMDVETAFGDAQRAARHSPSVGDVGDVGRRLRCGSTAGPGVGRDDGPVPGRLERSSAGSGRRGQEDHVADSVDRWSEVRLVSSTTMPPDHPSRRSGRAAGSPFPVWWSRSARWRPSRDVQTGGSGLHRGDRSVRHKILDTQIRSWRSRAGNGSRPVPDREPVRRQGVGVGGRKLKHRGVDPIDARQVERSAGLEG